jgi:hypothetical protein
MGYALIAWQVSDAQLAGVALVLAACVWGFFWVNWPLGKIFLGDGGSYFVGFSLAWVAVMLIERNPSVSAFAALLVCAHPVTEVLFSIYRRKIKKTNPGRPDRLHLHSLVKQRYVRRWLPIPKDALWDEINHLLFTVEIELIDMAVKQFGRLTPALQTNVEQATYYSKRVPRDSQLDPYKTIAEQFNCIRVCDPNRFPAFFELHGKKYKLILEKLDD